MSARVIVLLAVMAAGCAESPEPPAVPEPIRLTIGVHDIALRVPEGWLHLDHGLAHRFQRGMAQFSLADSGPATPGAFRREIEIARELFRRNQLEDAQAHLDTLYLRPEFTSERRWREFAELWRVVRDVKLARKLGPADVEVAYARVLARVEALPALPLPGLVERRLPDLDHGAQRDVAEQHALRIDGRDGIRVESWDRLSHDHRKSYLFVLNEGNLLVARMESGLYAEMRPALDALVESLEIFSQSEGS